MVRTKIRIFPLRAFRKKGLGLFGWFSKAPIADRVRFSETILCGFVRKSPIFVLRTADPFPGKETPNRNEHPF